MPEPVRDTVRRFNELKKARYSGDSATGGEADLRSQLLNRRMTSSDLVESTE